MTKFVKINDVKLNPNNPRIIKDDKFKKLVTSIKEFPEMLNIRPIVVNKDMIILGGNMRYKACIEAGIKEIPVIVTDLSEEKQREFLIKDNTSGGEWDWEILVKEWDTAQLNDWGLDIPDFEPTVMEAEEDDFAVPENGIETDIVLGDLFEIGEHRLLCGDSTDSDQVAKLMNGQKADMVFTDPPYNVAYEGGSKKRDAIANDKIDNFYQFLYDTYVNCYLVMRDGAPIYVAHSELERINFTLAFLDAGFKFSSLICWVKNNSTFSMNKDYKQKHEPIIYGWKQGANHTWVGGNCEDTVWEIKRPSKSELHPTMKPIELCERGIKNSSNKNAIVYEPFTGSGSTMVASHQLKRKCYGMELDPKYCQVIVDRMLKLDPSIKVLKNGKPYNKN
jgi:DNA modification methylase